MSVNTEDLLSLSTAEKLRIVEMLWDDLGDTTAPIPLPEWAELEAKKRRDELREPSVGLSHEETWRRIHERNG